MTCALCGRDVPKLTEHHLVPKSQHKRVSKRTGVPKSELSARTVDLCPPCHKMIHKTFDEKTLAADYDTIEKLRADDTLQTFVGWVRKQPPGRRIHIH